MESHRHEQEHRHGLANAKPTDDAKRSGQDQMGVQPKWDGNCDLCGKSGHRRFYSCDEGIVCGYCVNKRLGCRAT